MIRPFPDPRLDEVTYEGITTRQAIARRVCLGLEDLIGAHDAGMIDFRAMKLAAEVLVDVTLPFVDASTKQVITDAIKGIEYEAARLDELAEAEAEAELGDNLEQFL